jgi:hypothetical protein
MMSHSAKSNFPPKVKGVEGGAIRVQPDPKSRPLIPYKNFYDLIPKSIMESVPKIVYPAEKLTNIRLPSGLILVGSSGGGKTNWLIHFLSLVDAFDRVVIHTANPNEPLYRFLIQSLKAANIECEVFDSLEDVYKPESFDSRQNSAIVFDDFMSAPATDLKKVEPYFTRGRKVNVTAFWLTQSWFKGTPQAIRLNAHYVVIFKLRSRSDAKRICADSSLDTEPEDLVRLLSYIQSKGQGQFMLIDKVTTDPSKKIRWNWGDKLPFKIESKNPFQ